MFSYISRAGFVGQGRAFKTIAASCELDISLLLHFSSVLSLILNLSRLHETLVSSVSSPKRAMCTSTVKVCREMPYPDLDSFRRDYSDGLIWKVATDGDYWLPAWTRNYYWSLTNSSLLFYSEGVKTLADPVLSASDVFCSHTEINMNCGWEQPDPNCSN